MERRGSFQLLNCSYKRGNIRIKKGQGYSHLNTAAQHCLVSHTVLIDVGTAEALSSESEEEAAWGITRSSSSSSATSPRLLTDEW